VSLPQMLDLLFNFTGGDLMEAGSSTFDARQYDWQRQTDPVETPYKVDSEVIDSDLKVVAERSIKDLFESFKA
jgi:hypothetical protein